MNCQMHRNAVTRRFGLLLILGMMAAARTAFSAVGVRTVIAIPASPVLTDLSGDVSDFFPGEVAVVSYPIRGDPAVLGMHWWDRARWRWVPLTWDQWSSGTGLAPGPRRVMVVSLQPEAAARMHRGAAGWAAELKTVEGFGIHNVVNALHAWLKFSPSQWRTLSRRYGLELEDRNRQERRYGRFGPPGRASSRPDRSLALPPLDVSPVSPLSSEIPAAPLPARPGVPVTPRVVPSQVVPPPDPPADFKAPAPPPDPEPVAPEIPDPPPIEKAAPELPTPPAGLEDELLPPVIQDAPPSDVK